MVIAKMLPEHAASVLEIYGQGIATRHATFETEVPSWQKFDQKFFKHSRLVAIGNDTILGWAVIAPASVRECYKGVADVSIYVHSAFQGKGIGKLLLPPLITNSEENGIWTLQSLIHPENIASIHLHELFGFRIVGRRERIGQLHGVWKDIILMERRSVIVGT